MALLEIGVRPWLVTVLWLTSVGCGSGDAALSEPPAPRGNPSEPSGPCNTVTQSFEVASALHVAICSDLPEASLPPAGGDHYGSWAAFQSYDFPIPHGFLLHSMEHGALVFYYNCPGGCAEEVYQVKAWLETQAEDPLCAGTGALRRVVLTPDPNLDVRWGIGAWGHTLRATCFDREAFGAFYQAHYGKGPEELCNAGQAFGEAPCP